MTLDLVIAGRPARRRRRRRDLLTAVLAVTALAALVVALMIGDTFYGVDVIARVVRGDQMPGAAFTVGQLRLPRAVVGMLAGVCFGVGGVTFQTMLRKPLASPDVTGISFGASAAAVIGIVTLSLSDTAVSMLALAGALGTALIMHLLASRGGFADVV